MELGKEIDFMAAAVVSQMRRKLLYGSKTTYGRSAEIYGSLKETDF